MRPLPPALPPFPDLLIGPPPPPPPPPPPCREIDAKYHVVDKTKAAAASGVAKAKEMDAKYKITDKAGAAVTTGAMKIAAATATKPTKP